MSASTDYRSITRQPAKARTSRGSFLFATQFSPRQGLGPLFNRKSCISCHSGNGSGGVGPGGLATVIRVGVLSETGFDPLAGRGGPVVRVHSVSEEGFPCELQPGIPSAANVTSIRNTPD